MLSCVFNLIRYILYIFRIWEKEKRRFAQLTENKRFIEMKFLSLMTLRLKLSTYFASISYTVIHLDTSYVDLFAQVFKVRSDVGSRACY